MNTESTSGAGQPENDGVAEKAYRSYLESLLSGNRHVCGSSVDDVLKTADPIRRLYEHLFRRSLYEVGEMWERGRISVADEHLATAMTESLLTRVYPYLFEVPRAEHSAVISCIANEHHQIGGKMVADTFEMHGWDSYFLGANTPLNELLEMVEKKKPDVVALSVTIYSGMTTLLETIKALRERFADLDIWVGGQAFNWGGKKRMEAYPDVHLIDSLSDLETRLINWQEKK